MRSIATLSFGVLALAGAYIAFVAPPTATGDDGCPPVAAKPGPLAPPAAPDANAEAPKPVKQAAIKNALLLGLVGEWGCDCAYPTGGHASGGASAKLVLDGTAVMTESSLDWAVGESKEKVLNLGIWKVAADGKTLSYWGFSSHDGTADQLSGEVTDTTATVSGMTKFGPMRISLTLKDGGLAQQLWIDRQDMGVISYKRK